MRLEIRPLTPRRWPDLEKLFGPRGACGGCWCMWWRLPRSQYEKQKGRGNKRALKKIIESADAPGLIAYEDRQPVAWCALAPREAFPVLGRSQILQPVDDQRVWSVVCLFVAKAHRRRGMTVPLLCAAVEYAGKQGAKLVEGYPVEPRKSPMPDVFAATGLASAFRRAGFKEVLRRSPTRPIMRAKCS